MLIFEKNKLFFEKNNKNLYNVMNSETIPNSIGLEKLNEEFNYILSNESSRCFMHSIYDVKDEMRMMFQHVKEDVDVIILFGLGCGHALDYILENYHDLRYLLVIEPSSDIFKEVAKNYDLTKAYKKIQFVNILVGIPEAIMAKHISDALTKSKKLYLVSHISYATIFKDSYDKIIKQVMERIRVLKDGLLLVRSSIYPWLINGIKNLKKECIPVEEINHIFEGKTVILVGAGPSLNKNMQLLKKAKDKAIIIAGGSAIKILDSNGIIPHFRIAIDGLKREEKILEGIDINHIPLLFTNNLYYEIGDKYKGGMIRLINSSDYIGKYIYKKAHMSYLPTDSGSSVINSALSLVCQSKCKEVIFIGQDLSYTEDGLYAKGSNYSHLKLNTKATHYIKMKDNLGQDVYTTNGLLTMKYSFEMIIKKYPNVQFKNATEGGLPIDGTEVTTLAEAIEDISEDFNIEFYNSILCNMTNQEYMYKIQIVLKEMKNEVEELLAINDEIYKYIKKVEHDREQGECGNALLKDLKGLEKFNERLRNNTFYNEILIHALVGKFEAIIVNFEYNGSDVDKKVESVLKISLNRVVEAQQYATLANEMLKDEIYTLE